MKDLFIEKMYELSKKPYQKFIKKGKAWEINIPELIQLPADSLGFHLGCFLLKYNFEIQPKLEDHDVIHVLTNTGISVVERNWNAILSFRKRKKKFVFTTGNSFGNIIFILLNYPISKTNLAKENKLIPFIIWIF